MVSDGVLIALIGVAGGLPTLAVKVMLNGSAARSKRIEARQIAMDTKVDVHIKDTSDCFEDVKGTIGKVGERVAFIEGAMERRANPDRPTI